MRGRLGIGALLVPSLAAAAAGPACLAVASHPDGAPLAQVEAERGAFTISYVHSVTRTPVEERFRADGGAIVEGSMAIRDVNRAMDWRLPDEGPTTIAGLVIQEARMIPDAGQVFTFHGFRFAVLRKQRNRITALRITPLPQIQSDPSQTAAAPPAAE